jgi:5-methylcytosine-specific restriction endonuclease McrA
VVLKRDNWTCVYCGAPATQVHHKRYAKVNIGNEPIEWLVSVCNSCHQSIHSS